MRSAERDCGYDYRTVPFALKVRRLTLVGTVLLPLLIAPAQAQDADAVQKQKDLVTLRTRIAALTQKLEADRHKQDTLTAAIESAEQRIAASAAQLSELKTAIEKQGRRVQKTDAERERVEQILRGEQRALGKQLRAAYAIGERSQTKLLLNLDSAARLSRLLTYFDRLNHSRGQRIGAIRSEVQSLQTLLTRQRDERTQLQTLLSQREAAVAALKAGRERRKTLLAELAGRIANAAEELQRMQAGEQQLVKLLDTLKDALADIPFDLGKSEPFAKRRGKLAWPVKGKLLARFGDPKAGGRLQWNGLWISGAEGSPVKAVARGRVAYVGWMHRYGLIVVLEHDGNFYSMYGHNQSVKISAGEWVETGQAITTLGNTGGHDRPGLYFELRKGSISVDPKDWLKK